MASRSPISSRLAAIAATVLLVGAGCTDDEGSSPIRTTTTVVGTTTTAPASVEVLEAGSEPRRPLRLDLAARPASAVVLTIDTAVTQRSGDDEQSFDPPAVAETLLVSVADPTPDDARLSFVFTEVSIDRTGTDLGDLEVLELTAAIQGLVGLGGEGRITSRGELSDFSYTVPDGSDPAVTASLDEFADQATGLTVPLPAEPLGVGARWRTRSSTTTSGITVAQEATYEITDITDDRVTYSATLTQTGSDQALPSTGLPAGTSGRLVRSQATGEVLGVLDLARPIASSETTLQGTQVVVLTGADGSTREVTQDLRLSVTVRPVP